MLSLCQSSSAQWKLRSAQFSNLLSLFCNLYHSRNLYHECRVIFYDCVREACQYRLCLLKLTSVEWFFLLIHKSRIPTHLFASVELAFPTWPISIGKKENKVRTLPSGPHMTCAFFHQYQFLSLSNSPLSNSKIYCKKKILENKEGMLPNGSYITRICTSTFSFLYSPMSIRLCIKLRM